jgi:hypothetical protein
MFHILLGDIMARHLLFARSIKPASKKPVSRPLTPFVRARRERRGKPIIGLNNVKIQGFKPFSVPAR